MKILPIYNVFHEAIGYDNGQLKGRNTVFNARRLGIPNNTALFANLEGISEIDEAWIMGWVASLFPAGYHPGIYHDPVRKTCSRLSN
ncbi:glycoside hydrolase family 25 domain-containing protein [Litchfieldia alkalitelluris]|uniref:hypothetical protein n=1 Tax=Litchfieldia alkalitelluris TaxID=304268 RepID=UPI0038B3023F